MPKSPIRTTRRWLRRFLVVAALGGSVSTAIAQVPIPPAPAAAATTPNVVPIQEPETREQLFRVTGPSSNISLIHLDSRVLELAQRIKVVDGFNPDKVTVTALSPNRVRVRAENPGVTTIKLVDEFDNVYSVEVFVLPDTRELEAYLRKFFPGSAIEVTGLRDGVVLRGWVTDPTHIPQIMRLAESMYPPDVVQSQLQVAGASQVQLHVKVVEVQRTKLRELGFNFIFNGQNGYFANSIGGIAPIAGVVAPFGGPPTVEVLQSALAGPEMQWALTGNSVIFQGFLKALQTEGLAKILAEPILVTTSGRPASMLAGGEFPILVPQSLGNVTIQFREFGVSMEMVPIVLGNGRLRLDVSPEVSERDFSMAVTTNGFVVPGITTRRVNTQVEMRFGETLMIGGLISQRRFGTMQRIPFLGELPWVGALFSRKSYTIGETELVILVTPQMVAPMLPCQVPGILPGENSDTPTDRELFFDGQLEVPRFGPDCPGGNCPPGGMIPMQAVPMQPVPMAPVEMAPNGLLPPPPTPALPPSLEGMIVPQPATNGTPLPTPAGEAPMPQTNNRVKTINPFRSTAERIEAERSARVIVPASGTTDDPKATPSSKSNTPQLPGPIVPQ